jgi:serine/threonine-protein kinase
MPNPPPTIDSSMGDRNDDRIDLSNEVINGYRVLHRLGSGGMADVYLAFHESLQRHVALKVLRADLAASKDHIQRFLQEARSAASLIHPNIVQVYDIGTWEKQHFIAQEYIAGNTLRTFIHRRGSLSQPESLSIILQIAAALQKAASIGIVHRDIKPDNVLLTPEGEVKVADFGLARVRSQNCGLTEIGVALGTPTYMSPEQIQGQSVDARSDLYSLGATAYEMFAGRPPFEGETALALALQHLQNAPPDLATLRPDIDSELIDIVKRLLAKAPSDRFDSAADLIRAVKKIADRLSVSLSIDHPIPFSGILLDQMAVVGPHTTHLQTVVAAQARKQRSSLRRRLFVPLLATVAGMLTLVLSGGMLKRPLLRQPTLRGAEAVKTEPDIGKQFFAALINNQPMHWRAIEAKFPPNRDNPVNIMFNLKGWLQYSWLCLNTDRLDEAAASANKALEFCPSDHTVIRVLATVARGMVELQRRNDPEFRRLFAEAIGMFQSLPPGDQRLIEDSMPWTALRQWWWFMGEQDKTEAASQKS